MKKAESQTTFWVIFSCGVLFGWFGFLLLISSHLSGEKRKIIIFTHSVQFLSLAAEPDVVVSVNTSLIPSDISHSSTGSGNTVSLCLGMHSGLPHSLYVARWKWASAHNPTLPWLSATPHNTDIPQWIAEPLPCPVSPTDKSFSPQFCCHGLNSLQGGSHVTS